MKIKKYRILLLLFFVAFASACSDQHESKKDAEKSESRQGSVSNPELDCQTLKNQSGESGFLIPPSGLLDHSLLLSKRSGINFDGSFH